MEHFRCRPIRLYLKMENKNESIGTITEPQMDFKIQRAGIVLSGKRGAFIGGREEVPDGKAWISGDCKSIHDQGRKDARNSGKLDGDFGI